MVSFLINCKSCSQYTQEKNPHAYYWLTNWNKDYALDTPTKELFINQSNRYGISLFLHKRCYVLHRNRNVRNRLQSVKTRSYLKHQYTVVTETKLMHVFDFSINVSFSQLILNAKWFCSNSSESKQQNNFDQLVKKRE